jgi:hypothetical protein
VNNCRNPISSEDFFLTISSRFPPREGGGGGADPLGVFGLPPHNALIPNLYISRMCPTPVCTPLEHAHILLKKHVSYTVLGHASYTALNSPSTQIFGMPPIHVLGFLLVRVDGGRSFGSIWSSPHNAPDS